MHDRIAANVAAALLGLHDVDPAVQESAQIAQVGLFLGSFVTPGPDVVETSLGQTIEETRCEYAVYASAPAGPDLDHRAILRAHVGAGQDPVAQRR